MIDSVSDHVQLAHEHPDIPDWLCDDVDIHRMHCLVAAIHLVDEYHKNEQSVDMSGEMAMEAISTNPNINPENVFASRGLSVDTADVVRALSGLLHRTESDFCDKVKSRVSFRKGLTGP